jgi:hypothetical protein
VKRKKSAVGAAVEELEGLELGDARLVARARALVAALERQPAASFPAAVGHRVAEREAAYRLLNNDRVDLDALLAPHVAQTVARVEQAGVRPIVVIDKTAFVFPGEADRDDLVRLGADRQGFDAFFALAVSSARSAFGVLAIDPLEGAGGRSAPDAWNSVAEVAGAHVDRLAPIYVMDREADAYALFASLVANGRDFVVRVAADRWAREHGGAADEMLRAIAARAPIRLRREVKLSRRSKLGKAPDARRRHPPRNGRDASLVVRACTITLPRPRKVSKSLPASLAIQLIHVVEDNPPADVEPIEWLLFTTLPTDDERDVAAALDAYRARWTIEEYFKALKSGCSYEKRQLESRHALLNALGLLAPLAWRLLALRNAADDPKTLASTLLDADELHVLRKLSHDVKLSAAPTAADALLAIAIIGGHFKQNGRPGWKVIWTGFQKLLDRVDGYRLARAEM